MISLPTAPTKALPKTLLGRLMREGATGCLTLHNPFDPFVGWQIYLGKGKIHFATSMVGNGKRLSYLLGGLFQGQAVTLPEQVDQDYDFLCELWRQKYFTFQQTRSILTQFTQEALAQALSLPKTHYQFDGQGQLSPLFLNLNWAQAVTPIERKVDYWWKLRPSVTSPFQRPLVQDWRSLPDSLASLGAERGDRRLGVLKKGLENLHCLYDLGRDTQWSTLQLAMAFQGLIRRGDMTLLPYQEMASTNRPLVVSVDDHPAQQHIVQYTLEQNGYRVTPLNDPFKALAALQGMRPDLILMNGSMKEMDGYQLTGLCRRFSQLQDVPIVLLVDQAHVVERLRVKLCGAQDCLARPFLPKELLALVQKHLTPPDASSTFPQWAIA